MDDLIERLNGLCERHSRIPEGPYFVGYDEATDCPTHIHSGLSLVDTGRQSDWPIARLCESPTADAIAAIPTMLAALREAAAELSRLTAELGQAQVATANAMRLVEQAAMTNAELTAEVERLRAALRLIAVIDQRRSPHLGPARWSGIEKHCIQCIAAIARGASGYTATAEDFDAAIKEAGNG